MNARPRAVLPWSSLLLAVLLSQCATEPPYLPPGAGTGISLDTAPGRRSRQETRYLENTVPPPMPSPDVAGTDALNTPSYETPDSIDSSPPAPAEPPARTETPPEVTSKPEPEPEKKDPAPATTTPEQMPFGLPVPGKKGFVYSPFDKTQMVDVRGIPPGKKVRCPYTSKIFLVP